MTNQALLVELPETGHSGVTENLCLQEYGGIGLFSFESIAPLLHHSTISVSNLAAC